MYISLKCKDFSMFSIWFQFNINLNMLLNLSPFVFD